MPVTTARPTFRSRSGSAARIVASAILSAGLFAGCGGSSTPQPQHPGIFVSRSALTTAEGGADVSFEVRLNTATSSSVLVDVCSLDTTEGGLVSGGGTSSCIPLIFTAQNWAVPRTITVSPADDATIDGTQTYSILAAVDPDLTLDAVYAAVPPATVTVTNADDEFAGITVSKSLASTGEAGTTDSFTVTLDGMPSGTVSVPVAVSDATEGLLRAGTAPPSVTSLTLTFDAGNWSSPQTVTLYGQDDPLADGNRDYVVTVGPPLPGSDPAYTGLVAKTVTVTNLDDDVAAITIAKATPTLVTSENGSTASFTVRLNSEPQGDVELTVTSGSPSEGLLSAGTTNGAGVVLLTFTPADWATPQPVIVTGQDDAVQVAGDDVPYDVSVGPATGDTIYAALATQTVHVINYDNDAAALVLPAASTGLQTSETGPANVATFVVGINRLPSSDVVIPITVGDTSEGLIQGGPVPSPSATLNLTFTSADYQTLQTVTVVGQPDGVVDGSRPYAITVGAPTAGGTEFTSLAPRTVSVVNADTDVGGFTVSKALVTTTEGGAVTPFTVVLNRAPAVDVVIPVTSGNPAEGKLSGGDSGGAFLSALHLTFTPEDWSTPQEVQVQGQVDSIVDGNAHFSIAVGPTESQVVPYDGLAAKVVSAVNVDADVADFTVTPSFGLITDELGLTATFTVQLTSIPTAPVEIPLRVNDPGEILIAAGGAPASTLSLHFEPSGWNTPQTVTVTGQPDGVLDGNRGAEITVGPTSSGAFRFDALPAKTASGTNRNTDVGVSEGTGTPVIINLGDLPRPSQVGPSAESFYKLLATPNGMVTVRAVNAIASIILTVDDDGDYATGNLCTVAIMGVGKCAVTVPATGALFFRVSTASPLGAGYVLSVSPYATLASTDVPKAIPDGVAGGVTSSLTLAGATPAIARLTVLLSITHPFDSNLTLTLISPAGTRVRLSTQMGGSSDNYTGTGFADEASTSIGSGSAPFSGWYKPEQPLSGVYGENGNGTWRLEAVDSVTGSAGSITAWSIDIT